MIRFPFDRRAYLDWAAAAPVGPEAARAFRRAMPAFGNPSSLHAEGAAAKAILEDARAAVAAACGAKAHAVAFTSGATEANAIAIMGRARRLRAAGVPYERMRFLHLPTAHASTRKAMARLASLGAAVEELPLAGAVLDLEAAARLLRPETALVSCDAACSETGVRFDTRGLARAVADAGYAGSALVHVDASQLPLAEPVERTRLGADLLVLDAQKVGGVRGVGALVASRPDAVMRVAEGGGQEGGLRPGTEPVALAAAFAAALRAAASARASFAARAARDRATLVAALAAAVPDARVMEGKRQLPHILSLALPGCDTEYLTLLLDAAGFAVSTRSACDLDGEPSSPAILRYTGDPSLAASPLRISWGPSTPASALRRLPSALVRALPLARR